MISFDIKNATALIDSEDAGFLSGYVWHLHKTGHSSYLRGYKKGQPGASKSLKYLHRLITDAPAGMDVDHINGDGLDNRRENLRVCTRSQNNANRHRTQSKTSPIKGVHFEKCTGRWRAEIHLNGKRYTLGRFDRLDDAAAAYAAKAAELFGGFANPSRVSATV